MFKIITPEKAGISSKYVLKFIKALDKNNLCTHSFIMAKGDSIFAEGYYAPFHKGFKHRTYSISKSFVVISSGGNLNAVAHLGALEVNPNSF